MSNSKDPAQPFPSPGSAFIPPPVPGPHEFAVRIPHRMSKKDTDDAMPTTANGPTATPNGVALGSPNGVDHDPPDPPLPPPLSSNHPHHRLSTQSVTPLTSSRPAPPSPVVSRRASGLSRSSSRPVSSMSSASSRPVSGVQPSHTTSGTSSRPPSGSPQLATPTALSSFPRHPSGSLSTPASTTTSEFVTAECTPTSIHPPTPVASALGIRIRDYGFAQTDPRFTGQGPNVPRPNRPAFLARRLALLLCEEDGDDDDEASDRGKDRVTDLAHGMWEACDDEANGWNGFKWGFGHAWGFGKSEAMRSSGAGFPSRGDLDRNFGGEDEDGYEDTAIDDESEVFSDDEGDADVEGEPPLCPGLYRALYAFEPEGTAEMRLDEDQLVRVIGRGGGVGWAVVVKDDLKDTGVHALVPESYLELVRLDGEEDT